MKIANSNDKAKKVYIKTEECEKWWERNLWEAKKNGTSVSRLVEDAVLKNDKYPHNAAEIISRFITKDFELVVDTTKLTRQELKHLIDVYKALHDVFKVYNLEELEKAMVNGEDIGRFNGDKKEYAIDELLVV